MSRAVENCAICREIHWSGSADWHAGATPLCLDCHGELVQLDPYIFKCSACRVKHGFQGGFGGSGHYYRAGQLTHIRKGKFFDYRDRCVLSQHAPFLRWMRTRAALTSSRDAPATVMSARNRLSRWK